ncbi:MAG: hypothetical protein FWE03_03785 [Firmicutes bacterium]|nr:hypothetical protein [Bacillota bacterium]
MDIGSNIITSIAIGFGVFFAIDENGRLWAFGNNENGMLGLDSESVGEIFRNAVIVNTDGRMNNNRIVSVSAGENHVLALDEYGNVWGWGYNEFGQLRDKFIGEIIYSPILLASYLNRIISIKASVLSSFAIDYYGNLWAWGANIYGCLGDGTIENRSIAIRINTNGRMKGRAIFMITAYDFNMMAIDEEGIIWVWGWGARVVLNLNDYYERNIPRRIQFSTFCHALNTPY